MNAFKKYQPCDTKIKSSSITQNFTSNLILQKDYLQCEVAFNHEKCILFSYINLTEIQSILNAPVKHHLTTMLYL